MGIVLDLIILAILVLSIIYGYKRGLISVAFSVCAFAISLIITLILYTPVTNLIIENTEFDDNIRDTIIENGIIEISEDEEETNAFNKYIQEYIEVPIAETTNEVVEETATILAEKVVAIAVAIILFVVVRLAVILLKFVIGGIANLPIIKQFNKLGGLLYGILLGFLIIYVFLAILFFIVSVNNNQTIVNAVDSSFVSKILYANNIILNIIF